MLETSFEYDGLIWTRDGSYYQNSKNGKYHRYLWKKYNGEIPKGWVVHHIDCDSSNNDIGNLQCMSLSEHIILHKTGFHHAEETKEKLRQAKLGKKPTNRQPIKDLVSGKVFESVVDAALFFNVTRHTIFKWLKKSKPRKNVNLVSI